MKEDIDFRAARISLPVFILRLFVVPIFVMTTYGQISPGKLASPHSHLEGASQCTKCHVLAVGAPKFKCAECHQDVQQRIEGKRGLHARIVKPDGGSRQECVRCHPDHSGTSFKMIRWVKPQKDFDHREAGYELKDKHKGLECNACHRPEHIKPSAAIRILLRDKKRTFFGLDPSCNNCHKDEHRGQFRQQCESCHASFASWKSPALFEHSEARFKLQGRHQTVACASCHVSQTDTAGTFSRFRDLKYSECVDCHKDPHKGAFPMRCQQCHTETGWKNTKVKDGFDHATTKFPLKGKHAGVDCFSCHKSVNFKEPVAHAKCENCHQKNDPHERQFQGQDCAACHVETGFRPSTFDVSRHQKSLYPLVGKHEKVECSSCHKPVGNYIDYHPQRSQCMSCHAEAHESQFASKPKQGQCEQCHREVGFTPSTYSLEQHQKTKFTLTGGHAATPCQQCHRTDSAPVNGRFRFEDQNCIGCHRDPHAGEQGSSKIACSACHGTDSWQKVGKFDHGQTQWKLTGAHQSVACLECHRPFALASEKQIVFKRDGHACKSCHTDIHAGQFEKFGGQTCENCHKQLSWKPVDFNHTTQARFSLKGAHEAVPCASCHVHKETVQEREVLVYARAPMDCAACHKRQN